jgi:putative ABC transport system permease protein
VILNRVRIKQQSTRYRTLFAMTNTKSTVPVGEILRSTHQALRRNWGRTILTSLSMVVGTASLVLVVVAGISGRSYVLKLISGVGTNMISLSHTSFNGDEDKKALADLMNQSDLEAIKATIQGIQNAAPLVMSYPTTTMEGVTQRVSLIGTTWEYQQVRNLQVLRGRFIDENDQVFRNRVCVVTPLLANQLERDPVYDGTVNLHGMQFTVIGVFSERVNTFGNTEVSDLSAVIPLSVIRYFKTNDKFDQIYISAENMKVVPRISAEVLKVLMGRHRDQAFYRVDNLVDMLKTADRISQGLTLVLLVIAAISLIASGISIMNVMLMTVAERTREIGIKKAIGASRKVLLIEFLSEALILSSGGGFVGIFLGIAIPFSVRFFTTSIQIQIPIEAIIIGFGVTLTVGVAFGILPALKASRMDPVEALRYE